MVSKGKSTLDKTQEPLTDGQRAPSQNNPEIFVFTPEHGVC